jgi:hypothetical protein
VPLPPSRHPAAGQSSIEYVGLLAVVAAVLAAAGPAAGLPGVGAEVAKVVRTGVCIVGGDICRTADAEAAGLAPCTVSERRRGGGAAVTVVSIQVGERHEWTVARRSDGSVVVTRADGDEAGVSGGLGFEAGPLRLGVDGALGITVAGGTGWEFPDAETAARFLRAGGRRMDADAWPPAWRSGDAGLATSGWAGLGVVVGEGEHRGGTDAMGIEASSRSALGVRIGRGTTTLYFRSETQAPRLADAFRHTLGPRNAGPLLIEYTRDRSGPRELAFRAATHGGPGQVVDTVARLDLRVPANRAAAAPLLRLRAPWPPAVYDDIRDVILYTAGVGTVERSVFEVSDRSEELAVAGRLGAELGFELGRTIVDRRLVSASARTGGSAPRAREDCLA